ncbi:hypothetical protein ABFS83_06G185700 [Erythranthe nasuta]
MHKYLYIFVSIERERERSALAVMSETEGFLILDSRNAAPTRAKKEARPAPQNPARKKLADISNLPQNNERSLIQEKLQSVETTTYIEQLQKENMALVKMLAQRNKIIEQGGPELDRLRLILRKMQEQNQQLASSNSQMLADLNSGKDRLKVLQHELGCTSGLLKARKLQLEENAITKPSKNADAQFPLEGESLKEGQDDEKPHNTKMASQLDSLGTSEQLQSKEKTENRRRFTRRQSAVFKPVEQKPAEDSFQTDDTIVPPCLLHVDPVLEKESADESTLVKDEDKKDDSALEKEAQEFEKPNLGRPSRVAAKKVQSYKEIPLNVKMRRPE